MSTSPPLVKTADDATACGVALIETTLAAARYQLQHNQARRVDPVTTWDVINRKDIELMAYGYAIQALFGFELPALAEKLTEAHAELWSMLNALMDTALEPLRRA